MLNEVPNHEKVTKLADFSALYSSETGLDRVSRLIEICSGGSFLEDFEQIRDVDKEGYYETVKALMDYTARGALDPEDLTALVENFNFLSSSPTELEKRYQSEGVAMWSNFKIGLFPALYKRNEDGSFKHDISQSIGHEIGHSIMELIESEQLEIPVELFDLINQTDPDFESIHIQACIEAGLGSEIISKEIAADIIGLFLKNFGNIEGFLLDRVMLMNEEKQSQIYPENEEITLGSLFEKKELVNFVNLNKKLYNQLLSIWPSLKEQFKEVDISAVNSEFSEGEALIKRAVEPTSSNLGSEMGANSNFESQAGGPESLSVKKTPSTEHLGEKPQEKKGVISLLFDFIKAFGEATDITKN